VVGLRLGTLGIVSPVAHVLVDFSGYLQKGLSKPSQLLQDLWRSYVDLQDVRVENEGLQEELDRLQQEITRYREALIANVRLRRLLKIQEETAIPTVAATVVGTDLAPWVATITIDRGRRDGVSRGMVALAGAGVAGHVVDASLHFSKVLLISDPNSAVGALIQRNRVRGILRGSGRSMCRLGYVEKDQDVEVGDYVITSGTDQIFPKGLLIGTVTSVDKGSISDLFQAVTVTPAADLRRVEEVLLLMESEQLVETQR
jgi:rod shape-determining protein MreC